MTAAAPVPVLVAGCEATELGWIDETEAADCGAGDHADNGAIAGLMLGFDCLLLTCMSC